MEQQQHHHHHHDEKIVLLYYPEMKDLALSIVKEKGDRFKLAEIKWDRFPDGFPNICITDIDLVRNSHAVFLASLRDHGNLFEQLSVLYSLPRYLVKSLFIILPFFPTGTMERVDKEGDIATAMTMARVLTSLPLTQKGPSKLMIYDIHTLQNRFYFGDNVIPLLVTTIPLLLDAIKDIKDIMIAFPDEGSQKRFGKQFAKYEQIICTKVREGNDRIITIKEGDPTGKHVIIVDDLVQTGGTLIECKNALMKKGAAEVSAYVTHAVFPKESWKKFVNETEKPFKNFFLTNSCPLMAKELDGKGPFKVLGLGGSIAENVLKFD